MEFLVELFCRKHSILKHKWVRWVPRVKSSQDNIIRNLRAVKSACPSHSKSYRYILTIIWDLIAVKSACPAYTKSCILQIIRDLGGQIGIPPTWFTKSYILTIRDSRAVKPASPAYSKSYILPIIWDLRAVKSACPAYTKSYIL